MFFVGVEMVDYWAEEERELQVRKRLAPKSDP